MSEEEKSDLQKISYDDCHKLFGEMKAVIEKYFAEESKLSVNMKFLVVSRAINLHGMDWSSYFWSRLKKATEQEPG